ncbi:hypothetical protein Strop_2890 [Salinispora tropica CNB-440]|uniref:Uncharacterized protein n=1 Tax=Salinispora tropica (strain ATCC BAA-916 / DSM 44818 / JCM 13857 / NBRC 105044 / CNB-440) TaxID=369723 RepID=A4X8Y0_SALTO|nr:hypothetical protein Strop_2890 [Salinispora tropica CNB-440]
MQDTAHGRPPQLHRILRRPSDLLQPLALGHRHLPDEHFRPSTHRPPPPTRALGDSVPDPTSEPTHYPINGQRRGSVDLTVFPA